MPLTPQEKQQILSALDKEDRSRKKIILASLKSFLKWLMVALYAIYLILTKDPNIAEKLFGFVVKYCL